MLNLPQWEYELYYSGIHAIEARVQLAMTSATSVGFGGLEKRERKKFFENLNDLSSMGLISRRKKEKKRSKGKEFNDILSFING